MIVDSITRTNEVKMKVGDLVTNEWNKMGIITAQIGIVDRWWIEWLDGESYAMNGYKLWVVSCK
jgi:hypothetical protein